MKLWLLLVLFSGPDPDALYAPTIIERYATVQECDGAKKFLKSKRPDIEAACAYDYATKREQEDEKKKVRL